MRLLRAPVVAVLVFAVVLVGAAVDDGDDLDGERPVESVAPAPVDAPSTTVRSRTTVVPPPVTTSTVPAWIEGDDDPAAIDGRTWTWDQLADCESGTWGANKVPNAGTARWDVVRAIYQGGLQFAAGTWDTYAEPGFPADAHLASREQQIVVAEKVINRQGPRAWPTCAPRLGMIGPDVPVDDPITPSLPLAEPLP
jgi:hypothetical protein